MLTVLNALHPLFTASSFRQLPLRRKLRLAIILCASIACVASILTLVPLALYLAMINPQVGLSEAIFVCSMTTAMAVVITMVGTHLVTNRVERQIADPLVHLASLLSDMSTSNDFTSNVHSSHPDEIGSLYRGINTMLKEIHTGHLQRDIALSQLEESHSELLERQALLQSIVDNAESLIGVKDLNGKYGLVNRYFETVLERPRDKILDRKDEDLFPPSISSSLSQQYSRVVKSNCAVQDEYFLKTSEKPLALLITQFPLYDINGNRSGVGLIGHDIGPIKDAVRERESLTNHMQRLEKMQAIGQLAGGIAHDFNNILFVVLGYSSLATRKIDDNVFVRLSLENITKAAERAQHLVEQILTFSRTNEPSMEPLFLSEVIDETMDFLRASIRSTVSIDFICSATEASIVGDRSQISRLLINLCTNASQAISKNYGRVLIEVDSVEVDEPKIIGRELFMPGSYVRLRVSDTGDGIPPHITERIFEPFFTTKPVGEGSGLGLSVVHGIVKEHSSYILVNSTTGVGTTFEIYFPAHNNQLDTAVAAPDSK